MLEKCANPACPAKFLRLHDGRLFVTEVEGADQSNGGHARQREYFWLCSSCGRTMTVAVERGRRPQVVPLPEFAAATRQRPDTAFRLELTPKQTTHL